MAQDSEYVAAAWAELEIQATASIMIWRSPGDGDCHCAEVGQARPPPPGPPRRRRAGSMAGQRPGGLRWLGPGAY